VREHFADGVHGPQHVLEGMSLWITACTLGDLLILRREDLDPDRRHLAPIARRLRPAP
jgi:hypothetical protein